ncbi:MAG: c-type cytochrome [Candidatus Rokuibacteriota bacterium]
MVRRALGGLVLVLACTAAAAAGPLDTPGYTKAFTCSACHGPAGQSPSTSMPILAGMNPAYFKKAIEDYATGRRPSPEMEPYAKMVRELGVDEVASYFAVQRFQPTSVKVDRAAVARGKAAAQPCAVCHGADGKGDAAKLIPSLAGQPPGFLRSQLLRFKGDTRSPDDEPLKAVKAMLKTISDDTLSDLAAYYSTLR